MQRKSPDHQPQPTWRTLNEILINIFPGRDSHLDLDLFGAAEDPNLSNE